MKNLKRLHIGTLNIDDHIDITDPSYDKDVWCRANDIKVKPGKYNCTVWLDEDEKVAQAEITHEKYTVSDSRNHFKYRQYIGVDSGMAGFFIDKPNYTADEWIKFCNSLGPRRPAAFLRKYSFWSASGWGDGSYDIYQKENAKGEIIALRIQYL